MSYQEYFPFGGTSYTVGEISSAYRFTGKELDEFTGLYYFGARYYASWLGRWTTADPKRENEDGINLYQYCRNNPVGRVDSNGMASVEAMWDAINQKSIDLYGQNLKDLNLAQMKNVCDEMDMPMGKAVSVLGKWGEDESKAAERAKNKIVFEDGKAVNANGMDYGTYNPQTGEVEMVDNKESFAKKQKNSPKVKGFEDPDVKLDWENAFREMVKDYDPDDPNAKLDAKTKLNIIEKIDNGDYTQKVTSAGGTIKDVTKKQKELGVIFEATGDGKRRPESDGFTNAQPKKTNPKKTNVKVKSKAKIKGFAKGASETLGCIWMDVVDMLLAGLKLKAIYNDFEAIENGLKVLSPEYQSKYDVIVAKASDGKDFYKSWSVSLHLQLGVIDAVSAEELIDEIWTKQIQPEYNIKNPSDLRI